MWFLRHLEKLSGCGSQFTLYIGNDVSQWYTMISEGGCDWLAWTTHLLIPSKRDAVIGWYIWPEPLTSNGYRVYSLMTDGITCQFHVALMFTPTCKIRHAGCGVRMRNTIYLYTLVNEKSYVFIKLMRNYLCLSLFEERGWCTGLVPFSWVSHGRRSILFLQRGPYMLPRGWTFWLALGSFLRYSNSVESVQGSLGSVPISWVSHGRRSIFFLQRGSYMLPRGWTFWFALGSSYKPFHEYFHRI